MGMVMLSHLALIGAVTPNPQPLGIIWGLSEHVSSSWDEAYGVAVDASGIYVVGNDRRTTNGYAEWRIEKRSLTTGALIWGQSEDISNGDDVAYGVAVDGSGLYAVGWDNKTVNRQYEWRIEKRSLTTGTTIWTQFEDISNATDYASGVAVDASGIYVVGIDSKTVGNQYEWRIEKRSLTTGAMIWGQSEDISGGTDVATGVAVDASGLYVVGHDNSPGDQEWRVEKRSLTTGAIIWVQSENFSSHTDYAIGVAVDTTGVYVAGSDENTDHSYMEWRVEKRSLTTGAIIWFQYEDLTSNGHNIAESVGIDGSGVYFAGYDTNTSGNKYEWRVEKRSLTTGAIIWGVSEHISSSGNDAAYGVAVDASGVYVVGRDQGIPEEWRVEKRTKPQGDPLSATGMGKVAFTVNNGSFQGLAALDPASVSPLPPAGLTFPYGLFNCTIGNLTAGESVNVTATLPAPLPTGPGLMYWTFHNGLWRQLSANHFTVASNRTMFVLNVTDGVPSDDRDETANGVIMDIGGVAYAYNVSLVAGWNLVSLPVVPNDPTATNMLRSLVASGTLVIVWGYTGSPRSWKSYQPGKTSTLTTLNDGYGYWFYVRSAGTLYVNGAVIPPGSTPPAYALVAGWNLVGFKGEPNATQPKTVGQYLASINGSYLAANVWVYDNLNGVWVGADASYMLHPGNAMWILVTVSVTLNPTH
jgi:hypothetical protein